MSSSKRRGERGRPGLEGGAEVGERPDRDAIVGGDEAERPAAGPLQSAGEQHAERLVGEPSFEGIDDHVGAAAAREGLDEQLIAAGDHGFPPLNLQPFPHLPRQAAATPQDRREARGPWRRGRSRAGTCRRHRSGSSPRCRACGWRSPRSRGCLRSAALRRQRGRCRRCSWPRRNTPRSRRAPGRRAADRFPWPCRRAAP